MLIYGFSDQLAGGCLFGSSVQSVLVAEHPARVGAGLRQLTRVLRHRVDEAIAVGVLLKRELG